MEAEAVAILDGKKPYSISVYTSLLREYLFKTTAQSSSLTARVLLHSLVGFGSNDFSACLCLISERQHESDEIKALLELEDLIERGNYPAFWEALRSNDFASKTAKSINGFDAAMQVAIVNTLANSFQKVSLDFFTAALGTKDVDGVAKKANVKIQGNEVSFPENSFNTPEPVAPPKGLTTQDIAKILKY